jgi:hypothetical protein
MSAVNPPDPTDLVRHGFDAVSHLYRRDADNPAEYGPWLAALQRQIPVGASVLDLGCGCGIPGAKRLSEQGVGDGQGGSSTTNATELSSAVVAESGLGPDGGVIGRVKPEGPTEQRPTAGPCSLA